MYQLQLLVFSKLITTDTIHAQVSRRYSSGGPSGWTFDGLLIRATQLIGLHRDGSHFHLSPLDCEIRRRLWWQIENYDARVAEDHGLATSGFNHSTDGSSSDTKLLLKTETSPRSRMYSSRTGSRSGRR